MNYRFFLFFLEIQIVWYRYSQSELDQPELNLGLPKKKSEEDSVYEYYELSDDANRQVIRDFKSNPEERQSWPVISAAKLIKIYNDYIKFGFVRDSKGLDEIAQVMINNTHKLQANTFFMEHTESNPKHWFEDEEEEWNDTLDEQFIEHVKDENGAWRISDYALKPLTELAIKLYSEDNDEQKLQIIDRMLNIIHARSDCAAFFVEGGRDTLDQLAS